MAMGQFGDTTLTKVFVGGLAWETQDEAMREHFEKFGDILEAVIISDNATGRSKGYGFVTFKEAEAAKKACEDATPMINGRRANCNLVSLGARRARSSSTAPQSDHVVSTVGSRQPSSAPLTPVQWYYPAGTPTSFQNHPQRGIPFHAYGYSAAYITNVGYNARVGYSGSYMNGQCSQMYPGQGMANPNALMPIYPYYHFHQPQSMGGPAQILNPSTAGHITTIPAIVSKPAVVAPNTGPGLQMKVKERLLRWSSPHQDS